MQAEIAGTGLGLRIVQTILDRHGGALAVESVEGEGTTFTVRLKIARTVGDEPAGWEGGTGLDGAGLPDGLPETFFDDPVPEPA